MPPQSKSTSGPIDAVRCPHCGHFNDFRDMNSQQLLDTGHTMSCDRCQRVMTVTGFRSVQVVVVRQATRPEIARAGATLPSSPGKKLPPPRQATTLSPGQTRRLLGRR